VVTFRFYVVSTAAFFLALAVGVVVGSVLDGRIADSLQDRLNRVETSLDDTVSSIDDKNAEIEQLERYAETSAPFAVGGRLEATSSLVVAEDGTDTAAVEDLVRRLRDAGSLVEGIVWMEPRWTLEERGDETAVARIAGVEDGEPGELRSAAWAQVLGAVEAAESDDAEPDGDGTTTSQPPDGAVPEGAPTTSAPATTTTLVRPDAAARFGEGPLEELADAGVLRLQAMDGAAGSEGGDLVVVAVTSTSSSLARPGEAATELVRAAADVGVPAVLAEVQVPAEEGEDVERGRLVRAAVQAGQVGFSTVDHLDLVAGRVATALALNDLREGNAGRYGFGPDVDGVLPQWQGP
jgi:hypothetical protein